ncbi:large-conductance mechanosensitive channel protein MscL [Parablautia intestinalis]|jgi:large conductance mechanosensitive channel|uniref:large-conductance mechanosensitive channel protein MscL n=1 Tax=Parablautia intestinalis TaxID=2320100 RepID=UPI00259CC594|nr:large-conductance mechanosensitive channel protein MscL [Parablautia intestinalis]MCI8614983.1 large-conductance mechanosensitive channel protein MscL [Lachnospiraceae bacterium]
MKAFLKEFRKFISKGNVIDMAVGIIIGSAFTAIVNSLVNDVMMPLLSILTGGLDFTALCIVLGEGEDAATLNYGAFVAAVINFLLIAFVIFTMIKAINKLSGKKKEAPKEEMPKKKVCPFCKEEVAIDAVKCPHCISELTEDGPTYEKI